MAGIANLILVCVLGLWAAITTHAMNIPEGSFTGRKLLNSTNTEPAADKSVWQQIEEFYDDKNNFAMYLVLPLLVFVYGGCSLIYCIAKCRRHFKKKKRKEMAKFDRQDIDDDGPTTERNEREEPRQERRGAKQTSASDVRVAVDRENTSTPLPWQVPDDTESLYPQKNTPRNAEPPREPSYNHQSPPPPYDHYQAKPAMNRPMLSTVSNPGNDHRNRNAMESYAMAKQAAELLRQEEHYRPGGGGYKKAKRLVFVAD